MYVFHRNGGNARLFRYEPVLFFDDGARRSIAIEAAKDVARHSTVRSLRTVFVNHVKKSKFSTRRRLPCHCDLLPSSIRGQFALDDRDRGHRDISPNSWTDLHVLKIRSGQLATLAHDVVGEFLPFIEITHSSAFNRGNVDEYVSSAIRRLNEAKTLFEIEKLDFTSSHIWPPLKRRSASKSCAPSRRLRPISTLSLEEP
jgi:hypothetical protein